MTRRRFYAPPDAFSGGDDERVVTLAPEESRHLRDVLRLGAGDEAFVFDGEGNEYRCVVAEREREKDEGRGVGRGGKRGAGSPDVSAALEVRERVEPLSPESPLRVTLAVALLKGEKFDLVVQKATELGVWRIVPVVTKRADVRVQDEKDASKRAARWRRLALEAAKQSGRARVPLVDTPATFASVVAPGANEFDEGESRLMFAERGGASLIETTAGERASQVSSLVAMVGPEGGWDDQEIERAREAGWRVVTLGGRTLRAETAAITVAALAQHLFGDLK